MYPKNISSRFSGKDQALLKKANTGGLNPVFFHTCLH